MGNEGFTVNREFDLTAIVRELRRILLPGEELRVGIGILLTPDDRQVPGFELPEDLGKDTHFEMPPVDPFRERMPVMLIGQGIVATRWAVEWPASDRASRVGQAVHPV